MRIVNVAGLLVSLTVAACVVATDPVDPVDSADSTNGEDVGAISPSSPISEGSPSPAPGALAGEFCGGFAGVQCDQGLYCNYPPETQCGSGDQSGTCAVIPSACTKEYKPVCGCDDKTYGNACMAAASGVSVAHEGECAVSAGAQEGESCGGFTVGQPPVCAEGLYCSYAVEDSCGWADAPGKCAKRPEACTRQYAPVCGCDGKTYGNACTAASSGVAVLHEGECA